MATEQKVWVVNGTVHAICRIDKESQAWVYAQRPQHFSPCPKCKIYDDVDQFDQDQTVLLMTGQKLVVIRCPDTCPLCKYNVRDTNQAPYAHRNYFVPPRKNGKAP
jgi:hypothetical protein